MTSTAAHTKTATCRKCQGTGYLACFDRVQAGKCFGCDGNGVRVLLTAEGKAAEAAFIALYGAASHACQEADLAERAHRRWRKRALWAAEDVLGRDALVQALPAIVAGDFTALETVRAAR